MAHRALHLTNVTNGASVNHHLECPCTPRKSLNTQVLESAVGNRLSHLLELRARERLFQVEVTIFSLLHVGVDKLVLFRPDHFVSDLVVILEKLL